MPLMRCLGVVGTSRASFGVYTSPDDVDTFVDAVGALHTKL
jgi:selenocysteine lyase/cysteine desulfurase